LNVIFNSKDNLFVSLGLYNDINKIIKS